MATEQTTTSTSLAELRRAPTVIEPTMTIGFDSSAGFDLMQRGAKLLASSTLVPQSYQGNVANCVIALNMASRLGADPLLVMQSLYIVSGRPSWSSQFLIACFNQCGRFSAIRYKWSGTEGKDDWACQAYAKEKESGEIINGPTISIALAKKEGWYQRGGSKWQTLPQLMLMYRAAAWLVRTHAPELSMGLQTSEEASDIIETEQDSTGRYRVTSEDLRRVVSMPVPEDFSEPTSTAAQPPQPEASAPSQEFIDVATAKTLLKRALNAIELDAVWQEILERLDLSKELPPEIEAYYKFRKEAFAKGAK